MKKISDHITYAEATRTSTGVENTPQPHQIKLMEALSINIFEPLRKAMGGKPIRINSFFRSNAVNRMIGGAHKIINGKYVATSQHCKGMAMDLDGLSCTNADMFFYILDKLDFDQLIWEKGDKDNPDWIHVSYKGKKNRKNVLIYNGRSYRNYSEGDVNRPKKKAEPKKKAPAKKKATVKKSTKSAAKAAAKQAIKNKN